MFSAYMDIVYDNTKVELVGTTPITYSSGFSNGQTGATTTPGLIDEVGAFKRHGRTGPSCKQLLDVHMRVKATGQVNFSTNHRNRWPWNSDS